MRKFHRRVDLYQIDEKINGLAFNWKAEADLNKCWKVSTLAFFQFFNLSSDFAGSQNTFIHLLLESFLFTFTSNLVIGQT